MTIEKYAVAVVKGENEVILGLFKNEKEADEFGRKNRVPLDAGLCYCFSSKFCGKQRVGRSIRIHSYYNA